MTRLVLFDIDGTLIRTGGAGVKAFARTAAEVFGRPGGTAGLSFAGRTDLSLVREFLEAHGLEVSRENQERFLAAYLGFLAAFLQQHAGERCPGVAELLAGLRGHPQPPAIGLLTGNVRPGAECKLRAHGLWGEFEFGAFGDEHQDRNQLAGLAWQRGRERLGEDLAGAEIVVVGDTPRDVACARAIGARCLAVATGMHRMEELADCGPEWLCRDLWGFDVARLWESGGGSRG
ncbi:MAG: HAD family hydrolase [Verrucomicrobiota bacterium]